MNISQLLFNTSSTLVSFFCKLQQMFQMKKYQNDYIKCSHPTVSHNEASHWASHGDSKGFLPGASLPGAMRMMAAAC